ncbi:MAG: hypothetical protein ACP5NC_05275 [Nitrososphaeria archaeon]
MRDEIRALIITAIIAAILLSAASTVPALINQGATQKVMHNNGLELMMSINSRVIASGQTISVTISMINTLPKYNLVTASNNWPGFAVSTGPCGTMNDPMGIAIFSGYYTLSNITSAGEPMEIYEPGIYNCPAMFHINAYAFLPHGSSTGQPAIDNAVLNVNSYELSRTMKIGGYWSQSMPIKYSNTGIPLLTVQYKTFEPGTYTIVGADEWGGMVILHFQVKSSALSDK